MSRRRSPGTAELTADQGPQYGPGGRGELPIRPGVIDPTTETLYVAAKTYVDQDGGEGPQGRPAGRYYIHALDVNDLSERDNFPIDLEGMVARNNPTRMFNGGINLQRPGLLHLGQFVYIGFGSHCGQYNFTG